MTIKELRDLLNEEIAKGNGNKKVGYISIDEPRLCVLEKEDIGFYTEFVRSSSDGGKTWKKIGHCTSYIIGNLQEAKKAEEDEEEDY